MFKGLQPILYGGREVWPLIEGGKGVSATNHASSGAWAAAGGIGTVSAVNADSYDPEGRIIPQIYQGMTRRERHEELIKFAIDGAVAQVQRAFGHQLRLVARFSRRPDRSASGLCRTASITCSLPRCRLSPTR